MVDHAGLRSFVKGVEPLPEVYRSFPRLSSSLGTKPLIRSAIKIQAIWAIHNTMKICMVSTPFKKEKITKKAVFDLLSFLFAQANEY